MRARKFLFFTVFCLLSAYCDKRSAQKSGKLEKHSHVNGLIHESSPYLLQHAHNPVDWHPWSDEVLEKARREDKMILVSIGYSACHWCHVMEHETFEDEEAAKLMNENFICIKVDREERPDVDQVYMAAVQMISGSGGWPLNCFLLPDGRPFFGGTYFPRKNWIYLTGKIAEEFRNNRQKLEAYAEELTNGIVKSNSIDPAVRDVNYKELLAVMASSWKPLFDSVYGGQNRAPKFPMPGNYLFLAEYAFLAGDSSIDRHVELTLDRMALGGIYDHVGGGFARYSTDIYWKVPHFEKMLYDNAQLISLYSMAYRKYGKRLYLDVVEESIAFAERELRSSRGVFYSALDADSEGEEGRFYVWNEEDLKQAAGIDFTFAMLYFNLTPGSEWEGSFILHREKPDEVLQRELSLSREELSASAGKLKSLLFTSRSLRIRPGLDDKSLTSWNALMITAYTEAFKSTGERNYLGRAVETADFIWKVQYRKDGSLYHTYKNGKSGIDGFLEDYAQLSSAFLDLYQVSFEKKWLDRSILLAGYAIRHFYDPASGMFYFTSLKKNDLPARMTEVQDNVIPSSNSIMARLLYDLGILADRPEWNEMAERMLGNVSEGVLQYGPAYSNWARLMLRLAYPSYEVVFAGDNAERVSAEFRKHFLPNTLLAGGNREDVALLKNRVVEGKNLIYVCRDKSCRLPVESAEEAYLQIDYDK